MTTRRTGSTAATDKAAQNRVDRPVFKGVAYTVIDNRMRWANCPVGPGIYTGYKTGVIQTDVPCPYCLSLLIEADTSRGGRARRIAKVLRTVGDKHYVIGHVIPKSHRSLGCPQCRIYFTVPKKGCYNVGDAVSQ